MRKTMTFALQVLTGAITAYVVYRYVLDDEKREEVREIAFSAFESIQAVASQAVDAVRTYAHADDEKISDIEYAESQWENLGI